MKRMTKSQIEEFAVGYPYSTDYIEILLISHDYNKEKVHEILIQPQIKVVEEVRRCLKNMKDKHQEAFERLLNQ